VTRWHQREHSGVLFKSEFLYSCSSNSQSIRSHFFSVLKSYPTAFLTFSKANMNGDLNLCRKARQHFKLALYWVGLLYVTLSLYQDSNTRGLTHSHNTSTGMSQDPRQNTRCSQSTQPKHRENTVNTTELNCSQEQSSNFVGRLFALQFSISHNVEIWTCSN
jgi:hypothetical protein